MTTLRPAAVIVLAAGEGTRMRSRRPKVLHAIGGRSLVEHAMSAARGTHPDHLVVVVRHHRDLVAEHVTNLDPDVLVADQDEVPGTGRAVECGLDRLPADLEGTVLVTYGDVPLLTSETLRRAARGPRVRGVSGHARHRQPRPTPRATAASCAGRTVASSPSSSRRTPPRSSWPSPR